MISLSTSHWLTTSRGLKSKLRLLTCLAPFILISVSFDISLGLKADAIGPTPSNDPPSTVLAFGSCCRQYRGQSHWAGISNFAPDGFLWTGDAVYANCSQPHCVREAFEMLTDSTEYQRFVKSTPFIDGTWDDHDYGRNDGGREYPYKSVSQTLFLDFLEVPRNAARRRRQGVYTSRLFQLSPELQPGRYAKLILLDTRTHRQQPLLRSLGETRPIPVSSHITAVMRLLTSVLGLGWDHPADVLGDAQWTWLEEELLSTSAPDSPIVATVIVSSFQVMTTVPVFESWGHFPQSKRRLYQLIQRTKPPHVIFISGDVHFGQLLGNPDCVVELTSSGLTHSALEEGRASSILTNILFPLFLPTFHSPHRPNSREDPNLQSQYYMGRNFGTLRFEQQREDKNREDDKKFLLSTVIGTIHGLDGRTRLRIVQTRNRTGGFSPEGNAGYRCLDDLPSLIPYRTTSGFILFLFVELFFIAVPIALAVTIIWISCLGVRKLLTWRNRSALKFFKIT